VPDHQPRELQVSRAWVVWLRVGEVAGDRTAGHTERRALNPCSPERLKSFCNASLLSPLTPRRSDHTYLSLNIPMEAAVNQV
jgi:hypothetical protein